MKSKSQSFEASVARLDEIVQKMERGDVPLEDALKLFEEGTQLVASCTKLLDEAELKVTRLTKGAGGEPLETEFADDAEVS